MPVEMGDTAHGWHEAQMKRDAKTAYTFQGDLVDIDEDAGEGEPFPSVSVAAV